MPPGQQATASVTAMSRRLEPDFSNAGTAGTAVRMLRAAGTE